MIKYVKLLIILLLFSSAIFSQTPPTLKIDKVTGTDTLYIPVSVTGTLDNVKSISLQIQYDPNSIRFPHVISAVTKDRLSGLSNISDLLIQKNLSVSSSGGLITISWINTNTSGVNLSGTTLFNLKFEYKSDFSEIKFVYASIKNMAGAKLTCNFVNGSIAPNTDPAIMVKYPTGGETLEVTGSPTIIQWTTVYVNHVKIQYSSDDGTSWNDIVRNEDASLNSYSWTIPSGINSDKCKIKISDADAEDPSSAANDVSNSFIIDSTPTLTIVSPNGGEVLVTGGVKNINWTSKNVNNIKLEYTLNGTTWTTIVSSIAVSTASYDWDIPNTPSGNCKIRISDPTGTASDLSDANFSIYAPPVAVNIDNVHEADLVQIGEKIAGWYWYSPETYKDNPHSPSWGWHSSFGTSKTVNGKTYIYPDTLVVNGHVPVNIGSWMTNLSYFEMEISFDTSTIQFDLLSNIIDAMKPIGASVDGNTIHIIWSGDKFIDIHDKLFDMFFTYKNINDPDQWTDFTSTNWSDLDPHTNHKYLDPRNYSSIKIKTITARNSKGNSIDANSSAWVNGSLSVNSDPFVKLLYPIGGEVLEYKNAATNIKWVSRGVTNINLAYTTDGTNYNSILPSGSASSDGSAHEDSILWNLPNVNSNNCRIKLTGNAGTLYDNDVSPNLFSVTNFDSLLLKSPEVGDILRVGSKKIIRWQSRNIDLINIKYTTNYDAADTSSVSWIDIADNVDAKKYSYTWTVPNTLSTNCRIRISNACNNVELNDGVGNFEITNSDVKVNIPMITSSTLPDDMVMIPILVDQVNSLTYINFTVNYNSSDLTFQKVKSSSSMARGSLGYSSDNNVVRIVWIIQNPIDVKDTLFFMYFKKIHDPFAAVSFGSPNIIKDSSGSAIDIITDIKNKNIPTKFNLYQNYPNPFNPSTTIKFELPKSSKVNLAIYNTIGQKVATLVDEFKNAGAYEIKWNANSYASGIYFYLIRAGEFVLTKKMIFLK
jgi:hypothetical protein